MGYRYGRTHGQTETRLYSILCNIKTRCTNCNATNYHRYGGRGIRVCDEWLSFEGFSEWALSSGYRDGLEIDRIDNDGNYEPGNCRWTTRSGNCRNKANNKILTAFGQSKPMLVWSEDFRCVVGYRTLRSRIRYGWDHETAITKPVRGSLVVQ